MYFSRQIVAADPRHVLQSYVYVLLNGAWGQNMPFPA